MITLEELKEFISRNKWIYAKTYAKTAPHEYVVKFKLPEYEAKCIVDFAKYIEKEGYTKEFWGKKYFYIDIEGYKYWSCYEDIEETFVINREPLKVKEGQDEDTE